MQIVFHRPVGGSTLIDRERVKLAAKITGTDRDPEVDDAINAAVEYVQVHLNIPLDVQTVDCIYEDFQGGTCRLPFAPLSIDSIAVDEEVLQVHEYRLLYRKVSLPRQGTLKITMTAGFTQEALPTPIKQALLMLATDYLRNQQAQQEVDLKTNKAVENLLALYRMRSPL